MTDAASQQPSQRPVLPAAAATNLLEPATPQEYHSSMRTRASIALFLPLACLLGCTLPTTSSTQSSPWQPTGNWINWQFENGTAITSPPTGAYLVGAMQIQGSQATGIFSNDYGFIVNPLDMTGSFNSTTGALSIGSSTTSTTQAYAGATFTLPSDPTSTLASGTLWVGCPPPAPGYATCNVIAGFPSVGTEIAPLNGTYTGTLTESASTLSSPILSGTVSLALTQSSTPNASGQFPLTGTLTFTGGGCTTSSTINGIVNGINITNYTFTVLGSQAIPAPPPTAIMAYTNPTATQITIYGLVISPSPCSNVSSSSTTYTGTLTLQ